MINLIIDNLTSKILGYNLVTDETNPDPEYILLDDSELDKLNGIFEGKNLYYIGGNVIEQELDDFTKEVRELETEKRVIEDAVNNEYSIFMDNILNGMDLSEATQVSKENRDKKDKIQKEEEKLLEKLKEEEEKLIKEKLEEEEKTKNEYYLSMLAIIRDENEYLVEWLNWYFNLGFEHFFIYDNESRIPIKEYLESINYDKLNKITVTEWKTSQNSQQDAYNHFLKNYRKASKWIFECDPDELLYIKDSSKTLIDFLKENEDYEVIKSNWVHFNANGHETKTEGTQFERFTQTTDCLDYLNGGKYFVQTNRAKNFVGYTPITRFSDKIVVLEDFDFFQLNHYITRSYEEWLEKMDRGTVLSYATRNYQVFFKANTDMEYLNTGENYVQLYGSPNY